MVKAEDSWLLRQHFAHRIPNLNCTSMLLQHEKQDVLRSSLELGRVSPNAALPGFKAPNLCSWGTDQTSKAHGLFNCLPPHGENLPPNFNPDVKEEKYALHYGHRIKVGPNAVFGSTQRRFIIFDQSGNHTRLFLSPIQSPVQNAVLLPTKFCNGCDLHNKGEPSKMGQSCLPKPTIQMRALEEIGEGSEMHEDTDEINALLYSDDDGGDSEEDEVTSTGRSPFAIQGSYKKREHMEEITAEIPSSDGPSKRQRLLDGRHKKSTIMSRFCEYKDDANSTSATGGTDGEELDSILGDKQSRKDKIRETLKILEGLIPGVKSKDPLSVIEEAISYLKYLKLTARALGVS